MNVYAYVKIQHLFTNTVTIPDFAEPFLLKGFIPNNKVNQQENIIWGSRDPFLNQTGFIIKWDYWKTLKKKSPLFAQLGQ